MWVWTDVWNCRWVATSSKLLLGSRHKYMYSFEVYSRPLWKNSSQDRRDSFSRSDVNCTVSSSLPLLWGTCLSVSHKTRFGRCVSQYSETIFVYLVVNHDRSFEFLKSIWIYRVFQKNVCHLRCINGWPCAATCSTRMKLNILNV